MINRDVRVDYIGRDRTQTAVKSVQAGVGRVNKEMSSLATQAISVQRTFAALTLGFAGGNFVKTLGDLQTSMARIRGLSQNYASDQQFLSKVTKSLNLDIQESTDAFSRVLALQNQGLIGNDQARDLFVGYQEAAIKFGASSSDIQLSMTGLRQALTAGTLRAQEFDQITDSMSAVLPAVAKQMGITTKELLKFRTSASLSSKEFVDALIPALLEFEGSAEQMSGNIGPQLKRLSNAYKEAIQEFETPIGDGVQTFVDAGIASIDAFVDNADRIKEVGVIIAGVYGARAASSVLNFVGVQGRAIQSSVAHTQALRAEAGAQLQNEAAALSRARAEQAYTTQKLAQTQAALAANRAGLARNAVLGELAQRQARAVTATNAAVVAQDRYNAALGRVGTVQRATAISATALAGAQRGLNSALSLVGGPAGAATLAALAIGFYATRQTSLQKATTDVLNATRDLNDEFAKVGETAFINAENRARALEDEMLKLIERRNDLESGNVDQPLFGTRDDEAAVRNLQRRIDFLKTSISELRLNRSLIENARATSDEFEALDTTAEKLRQTLSGFNSNTFIEQYTKDAQKLEGLRKTLDEARASIAPDDEQGQLAIRNLQSEIDKLSGATRAREEYNQKVKASDTAVKSLAESLKTERELIKQRFNNAEDIIELNIKLTPLEEGDLDGLLDKARARMNKELEELNKQEIADLASAVDEKRRLRDQEIADFQAYRQRITDAQTVIDPTAGIAAAFRDEILALNQERGKSIQSDEDYYVLAKAAKLQFVDDMAALDAQRIGGERKAFKELSLIQQASLISSNLNDIFKAFEKDVGQRIILHDTMTAAEKEAAAKQNEINRKKFEDNKKYQLAQAAVNIAAGIIRAYADYDAYTASVIAAGIALVGHKQIQNIRSGTFGSSGTSVSTGGGQEVNPNDQVRTDAQNSGQQINNVIIIGGDNMSDAQRRRLVVQALDKANENDEVNLPGFEVNQVVAQI